MSAMESMDYLSRLRRGQARSTSGNSEVKTNTPRVASKGWPGGHRRLHANTICIENYVVIGAISRIPFHVR
eukprot:10899981-Lingulodinium_polyedra.AAC.1